MSYLFTPGSGTTMYAETYGSTVTPSAGDQINVSKLAVGANGSYTLVTASAPLPAKITDGTNSMPTMDAAARAGTVVKPADLISVTLTLDTSAYASGDLLADAQAIASAVRVTSGQAKLVSLTVIDEDDQGVAFDIYITSSSGTWGTENSAPSISDSDARSIQAKVSVATGDYKDLGGVRIAHFANIQSLCEASGSTSLYVAVVNGSGTPTFTASGVRLVFGFEQY